MTIDSRSLDYPILRRATIHVVLVLCWAAAVMFCSRYAVESASLKIVVLGVLAVFIPSVIGMLYVGTVKKIESLQSLNRTGILHALFSSRIFTTIIAVGWSAAAALMSVFWFASLGEQEAVGILLSVVLYALVVGFLAPKVALEMRRFTATKNTLRWSGWIFALIMAVVFFVYQMIFLGSAEPRPLLDSVSEVLGEPSISLSKSILIQIIGQWTEVFNLIQSYFLHQLSLRESLYGFLALPLYFLLFYNFSLLLSPFFISRIELRRVVAPISDVEFPAPLAGQKLIFPAAWTTIIVLVGVFSFLKAEDRARYFSLTEIHVDASRLAIVLAEKIDGVFYRPGTSDELICSKLALYDASEEALQALRFKVRTGFSHMRANVDPYLDAYYSLPAEYLRLGQLAVGSLEAELSSDLQRALAKGNPLQSVDATINDYLATQNEATRQWRQVRGAILAANQLEISNSADVLVTGSYNLSELLQPPGYSVVIGPRDRMLSAGAAGASAVVATKVVGKVAGKGALKAAAQAVSKVAFSKVGGGAVGGALGATIGSAVPGLGTVIGWTVGTAIGLGVSVIADFTLLKLDEIYSRPEFKSVIIEAINKQEMSLLEQLKIENTDKSACSSNNDVRGTARMN
jgi:hypothetical protein